ncbi:MULTISPECIES: DUF1846 domain-containing protein [Olsenella]|uniref:DUF1846 domain-containing protein n=1 Tax=Olsenella TaxID=133925 RepID=UPI000231EEF6|nr:MULTISPECIES: DUF1846 domain-containing protein [Olsenella]EHF01273.1 hypothetical protein HMPREF1008_01753 [Olsenella sp. oral taxon 809 str. F0356]
MHAGFDNDKYIEMQAARIRERIDQFGGKLYLEFGGKLFDDYHASRVLPGFEPDSKARMLRQLADDAEVVFAVSAIDIEQGKRRGDLGITYDEDVLRLMDVFRGMGLSIGGVVITRFSGQPKAEAYQARLEQMGIEVYRHYPIADYPSNIDLIVSDEGFGKNEYVKTTKPLVVVTAPGPGSGKLAVCLSQLYNEHVRGIEAGYAKFETFPVWNLPLKHPVNVAYEAATADLDDNNIIDPYHLEAHGEVTVNYNRDVETFPVLRAMMEKIAGHSPYQSPTDMGVNMVGYCISDDDACRKAALHEIVRRHYWCAEKIARTGIGESELRKIGLLMKEVGVDKNLNPAHAAALLKEEVTGKPAGAMVLPDGSVVTGKTSELLGAASSLLLNALKRVAGVEKDHWVVSDEALAPISRLKTTHLKSKNPRLHSDETLIALSISSASNPEAKRVIEASNQLHGCTAYFSVIISSTDERVYRKLGINVCCEPKFERGTFYHR